jgi:hypothetical protein
MKEWGDVITSTAYSNVPFGSTIFFRMVVLVGLNRWYFSSSGLLIMFSASINKVFKINYQPIPAQAMTETGGQHLTLIASYATSREFGLMIPGSTSLRNSCLLSWSLSKSEYAGMDGLELDVEAGVGERGWTARFFRRFSIAANMASRSDMGERELDVG